MRILSATVHVACDRGAESATVSEIVALAGVSRRTFYELFEDRGDCLLAAIDQAVALAGEQASAAYEAHDLWADRVRAGLLALLQFLDEEPMLARLCVVEAAAAGPAVLARRRQVLDQLARVVDEGRAGARRQPPPLTAEGVVGGALGVVYARVLKPDSGALVELLNPLTSLIVHPYLGGGAARRELRRPAPDGTRPPATRSAGLNPLEGLDTRLTYRTMRVLAAIGAEAGLSNSDVSERAGVSDQGQISRMLVRLTRLGLIENTGEGQARGAANAWRLTLRGRELERAMRRESRDAGR
jgi:AcrR family transcriptional regulator